MKAFKTYKKLHKAVQEVVEEYTTAARRHGQFSSEHEGWAILREEVDELWDEVKKKSKNRSRKEMREEARQVAAMALRFMVDLT